MEKDEELSRQLNGTSRKRWKWGKTVDEDGKVDSSQMMTACVADKMERLMSSGVVKYFDSQEGRHDAAMIILQSIEDWINLSTDMNAEPMYPSLRLYSMFGLNAVAIDEVSSCLRHIPNRLTGKGVFVTR